MPCVLMYTPMGSWPKKASLFHHLYRLALSGRPGGRGWTPCASPSTSTPSSSGTSTAYLTAVSRRVGDCLELANGLRIFPGMETDVAEGGHILSIGPLEAILELNRRLEPHKEKETFLPWPTCWTCWSSTRSGGLRPLPGPRPGAGAPWSSCAFHFWTSTAGHGAGPGAHPASEPMTWDRRSRWYQAAIPTRRCSTAALPPAFEETTLIRWRNAPGDAGRPV